MALTISVWVILGLIFGLLTSCVRTITNITDRNEDDVKKYSDVWIETTWGDVLLFTLLGIIFMPFSFIVCFFIYSRITFIIIKNKEWLSFLGKTVIQNKKVDIIK